MYAVNTGSWHLLASSYGEAIDIADGVLQSYANQGHPWGTLAHHQIIIELTADQVVNSEGEIEDISF
jgi:hypothetical protein